jgi:hypothetical protein
MPFGNSLVLIFETSLEAGSAVQGLLEAGLDRGGISVIGRSHARCEWAAFWKEMSFLIGECAPHELPALGPVLVAGPMTAWMSVVLANAPIFGGLDVLGAVLHSLGISRETIYQGEAALKDNSFLVVVHGPAREIARAKQIIQEPRARRSSQ